MINNCFTGVYSGFLPDKRISRRVEEFAFNMLNLGTSVIHKIGADLKNKTSFYRMINNDRFNQEDLLNASYNKCSESVKCKHILAIQDTTEFNYKNLSKKLDALDADIGPTTAKYIPGFFCHPTIVVNSKAPEIYGLSYAKIYNRSWGQPNKNERKYKDQAIEEKESYKWIESAINTKQNLSKEVKITIIGDRECDIYDEFIEIPDDRTNVLIRSRVNRIIEGDTKLYEFLDATDIKTKYHLEVTGKNKRQKRTAELNLKFTKVNLKAPKKYPGKIKNVEVYAIEVKETKESTPDNEEPILWRLLTSHKVETVEQAIECVKWYKQRWLIEELFRVVKSKGFKIEESQLGTGIGLKKLLAITLEVAITIMRLKLSLNNLETKSEDMFCQNEIDCLKLINQKVEGSTEKQKNPYPKDSLAWVTWTIARLAGWSGYKSHGPPGYITIKEGYDKFVIQYEGYSLWSNKKDVYKD